MRKGCLPRAEAGKGRGSGDSGRGQRAVSSPKRHHKLHVDLLFWRDKGSTNHRGPDLWPHPIAGTQSDVQGKTTQLRNMP